MPPQTGGYGIASFAAEPQNLDGLRRGWTEPQRDGVAAGDGEGCWIYALSVICSANATSPGGGGKIRGFVNSLLHPKIRP